MGTTNSSAILSCLLEHYSIPVTKTSVESELEKHPYRGNLFAISDILNHWKVPNAAFRVEFESLQKIPLPCLAHLNSPNSEFAVVHYIDNKYVRISNGKTEKKELPHDVFKQAFSGNVLVLQKEKGSGEEDYEKKRRKEILKRLHYPSLGLCLFLILLTALINHGSFFNSLTWQIALAALFKTVGLVTCGILLVHSIDANNSLIKRLCTGVEMGCNNILSSNAGKLTTFLSWSEMGFFYFSGTWLFLIFNNNSVNTITWLTILNLPCLLFSFYSIYYQWRVAKQWCPFCLVIQAIFWLEFIGYAYTLSSFTLPSPFINLNLVLSFALPISTWYFVKPFLKEKQKGIQIEQQLRSFKFNEALFHNALHNQKKLELLEEDNTIILGNVEAENIITIVSNPYCQPCSEAHKLLAQWLSEKDSFKVQVLLVNANKGNNNTLRLIEHFHQLYCENREIIQLALHDWYEGKLSDVDQLIKKYPIESKIDFSSSLQKQTAWCEKAEIEGTPTIFLNGYRLPEPWHYPDIKYFL